MNRKQQVTEMKSAGDQFQHYLVIVVLISQVMISVGLSVLIFLTVK